MSQPPQGHSMPNFETSGCKLKGSLFRIGILVSGTFCRPVDLPNVHTVGAVQKVRYQCAKA
jgi:hypothetical protein